MSKVEMKDMDVKALEKEITSIKKELFDIKLSSTSSHIKDNSQFKKLRAKIARAKTYLREAQLSGK